MPRAKSTGRRLRRTKENRTLCKCGHKREKHDFAISETDNVAQHCLGGDGKCRCSQFTRRSS